jgi:hypothetical protein
MRGQARASTTLDVYADLFDDDLAAVADRLDEMAQSASAQSASARILGLRALRR